MRQIIFYKISCLQADVLDLYIGHTGNFVKRKFDHKKSCVNNVSCSLYDVIRQHGGWSNWKMEILETVPCLNKHLAKEKELQFRLSLNATLDTIPLPKSHLTENPPVVVDMSIPTPPHLLYDILQENQQFNLIYNKLIIFKFKFFNYSLYIKISIQTYLNK